MNLENKSSSFGPKRRDRGPSELVKPVLTISIASVLALMFIPTCVYGQSDGSQNLAIRDYDYSEINESLTLKIKNLGTTSTEVLVSLTGSSGVTVSDPPQKEIYLGAQSTDLVNFKIVKKGLSSATVVLEYAGKTERISLPLSGGGEKNVSLWDYEYDGENLKVELKNTGGAEAEVLVSLRDEDGILVGDPLHEQLVINGGEKKACTFELTEDLSSVNVVFEYGGQKKTETITNLVGAGVNVSISASTPSLEVALDSSASYQIVLTNEGDEKGIIELIQRGLPESIDYGFYSGEQQVSKVSIEGGESRTLEFYVSLPSAAENFEIDNSIEFDVFALNEEHTKKYETDISLENTGAPGLELSLIPSGSPDLEVSLDNLYARVKPGKELNITANVKNSGTEKAEDIEINVEDLPYGWSAFPNPDSISSLFTGEGEEVDARIVIPDDASAGHYEFSIEANSDAVSGSETFEVRIEETSSNNMLWIATMIIAVLVIAGVMIKFRRE